jgi:large subunit ribosomal protein L21
MYAVIKTGGKQYRVQPGDVLVVEKLAGEPGAQVAFDQVLMLGDGGDVTLGAPLVEGALVRATLIETRKGEKVNTVKKIRRQGHRRTKNHRQTETVLRVIGMDVGGKSAAKWDGEVDLTPLALLNARARNLTNEVARLEALHGATKVAAEPTTAPTTAKAKTASKKAVVADVVDEQAAADLEATVTKTAAVAPAAPKKAAAPKAAKSEIVDEQAAATETAPKKKAAAPKTTGKAKPASDDQA